MPCARFKGMILSAVHNQICNGRDSIICIFNPIECHGLARVDPEFEVRGGANGLENFEYRVGGWVPGVGDWWGSGVGGGIV